MDGRATGDETGDETAVELRHEESDEVVGGVTRGAILLLPLLVTGGARSHLGQDLILHLLGPSRCKMAPRPALLRGLPCSPTS